ncbi:MAG TPA: hypothetical protein VKA59_17985 [Vicinamibacterales bacterium]|nr:hypothetical protein [Vicinamibacterales bacterium]
MSEERNNVMPRRARRTPDRTLIAGMTLLLLVVIGVFVSRMIIRPSEPDRASDRSPVDRAGERLPAGFDPQPKFGSTRDEVEHRGAGEEPQGPMPGLGSVEPVTRLSDITGRRRAVSGQRVELKDVEVESADAVSFWIKDGKDKIAVVGPAGTPSLRGGQRVSVSGQVDVSGRDARINATRVELND